MSTQRDKCAAVGNGAIQVPCICCPLAENPHFKKHNDEQFDFLQSFKSGDMAINPQGTILIQGTHSAHLYTVLTGWAFRYKILEDGRRQILNYAFPGDLIGLQGGLFGEMEHSVEALTPVRLCVFEKEKLFSLYASHPELAFDVTWIAAREERILDEHLLSLGRRSALERAAYLLLFLYNRAKTVGLLNEKSALIPITQTHVADTLGLSVVHTNKTLRRLANLKMMEWRDRGCRILDPKGLAEVSGWDEPETHIRPFI